MASPFKYPSVQPKHQHGQRNYYFRCLSLNRDMDRCSLHVKRRRLSFWPVKCGYGTEVSLKYENDSPVDAKGCGRRIMEKVYDTYTDGKSFAYDGEKSLFTVGSLPRNKFDFIVILEDAASHRLSNTASLSKSLHESPSASVQSNSSSKITKKLSSNSEKGLLRFKNALAEFVKEILKPTWKEGRMSRDAHKTVVDKVSGTIQVDHIPSTQDKIQVFWYNSGVLWKSFTKTWIDVHCISNRGEVDDEGIHSEY